MQDEATAGEMPRKGIAAGQDRSRETPASSQHPRFGQRPHARMLHGMRKPANWLQLVRFGAVGGSGFVVNIAVYALCVHAAGLDYRVSSVAAWLVAVLNNFVLNRHWTFDAAAGSARLQGMRFFLVSLVAEGFSLLALTVLVEDAGMEKVAAQALAVAAVMPLNFLGNKLWSFRAQT
jgi:putative flippase GtrA